MHAALGIFWLIVYYSPMIDASITGKKKKIVDTFREFGACKPWNLVVMY